MIEAIMRNTCARNDDLESPSCARRPRYLFARMAQCFTAPIVCSTPPRYHLTRNKNRDPIKPQQPQPQRRSDQANEERKGGGEVRMDAIEVLSLLREWTCCRLLEGRDELGTACIHVRLVTEDGLARLHIWTEIVNCIEAMSHHDANIQRRRILDEGSTPRVSRSSSQNEHRCAVQKCELADHPARPRAASLQWSPCIFRRCRALCSSRYPWDGCSELEPDPMSWTQRQWQPR